MEARLKHYPSCGLGAENFYEEEAGADDDAAVGDVEVGMLIHFVP